MVAAIKQEIRVNIRWMLQRDLTAIMSIEQENFEFPWAEEDYGCVLRQFGCLGVVAEHRNQVVGFMIYELWHGRVYVLDLGVAKTLHRRGVGTQLLAHLLAKLGKRRNKIILEVRESNLDAQLFFRDSGFKAVAIFKNFYEDIDEDAYLMQYHHGTPLQNQPWVSSKLRCERKLFHNPIRELECH